MTTTPAELVTADKIGQIISSRQKKVRTRVIICGIAALAMLAFFMTYDALDAWEIIAKLRIRRLLGLTVVAVALSCATVIFQVVTRNRILSPSVMGFDAMYSLVVTAGVFFFTSAVINHFPAPLLFGINAVVMSVFAVTMFMLLLRRGRTAVHVLVLVGIVVGTLLRSITTMMTIVMDPNEYLNVQDRTTASFAVINVESLWVTLGVTVAMIAVIMWRGPLWDLLYLGEDTATALGVRYRREVKLALGASTVLVACATALVGPLMFFGLLIVNIAVFAIGASNIRALVPASAFLGIVVLVGGQGILEFVLDRGTVLPVVIELVGGALLLVMIVKEARR